MAVVRKMTVTVTYVLVLLGMCVAAVYGADCTTEEGCREHLSCKTGGTVYCCPGGERLMVNGTSGECNCNATGGSGLSCSGGAQIGQGSSFLPAKAGDEDCKTGSSCSGEGTCTVGGTSYCCPGGHVSTLSIGGQLRSCTCRFDIRGNSCSTRSASPRATSASALTCAAASLVALLISGFMLDK